MNWQRRWKIIIDWKGKVEFMSNEIDAQKNAVEFLVHCFFSPDKNEDILAVAIRKAYSDATRQKAYNFLFSEKNLKNLCNNENLEIKELSSDLKATSKSNKETATTIIRDRITALKKVNPDKNNYDDWHEDLCDALVDQYKTVSVNNTRFFTYGNAQKWVNMTMKYLYLFDVLYFESDYKKMNDYYGEFHDCISGMAQFFHVPIDRFVLQFAEKKYGKIFNEVQIDGKKEVIIYGNEECTWSCIPTYSVYKKFQNGLRSAIKEETPIEWESREWLSAARNR